jgi:hypothetical protein
LSEAHTLIGEIDAEMRLGVLSANLLPPRVVESILDAKRHEIKVRVLRYDSSHIVRAVSSLR